MTTNNPEARFAEFGIHIPHILLPSQNKTGALDLLSIDLLSWALPACDQYTQDEAYWERAKSLRKNKPSTLDLILPEIFLELESQAEKQTRIEKITQSMSEYLDGTGAFGAVFAPPLPGMVYVERKTAFGRTRRGIVTAIDLERYDWRAPQNALIRATEKTVPERLPPRMEIRRNAPLESSHVMLLVDDRALIDAASEDLAEKLYSGELMQDAGSITGWRIGAGAYPKMLAALERVAKSQAFLFAVGDGNHSLAAAKAVWDEYKLAHNLNAESAHQKRYALAEIVSLYDEGLVFEPIHRVLFCADGAKITASMADFVQSPKSTIAEIQDKIDAYLAKTPSAKIDYIHGKDEVERLVKEKNALAVFMPAIEKSTLFSQIEKSGTLPRKSFSMGEASEKRFYVECRKLF